MPLTIILFLSNLNLDFALFPSSRLKSFLDISRDVLPFDEVDEESRMVMEELRMSPSGFNIELRISEN